ncbi:MAG: endopeptidase La [Lachnospiraceae bacterium]|nr:endopeptidase La [Lachnospiraceae bacterium]
MMEERKRMPAVALRGLTIFPDMMIHFDLSREKSKAAIEQAMIDDQMVFLVTQKESEAKESSFETVYHVGCTAKIKQVMKMPGQIVRVLVEGAERGELKAFTEEEPYLEAEYEILSESDDLDYEVKEAMLRRVKELFQEYSSYYKKNGKSILNNFDYMRDLGRALDQIAMNAPFSYEKKQQILETLPLKNRYEILVALLEQEIEIAKIKTELASGIRERIEKNQKNYILREQLNYIKGELGERADTDSEAEQFRSQLKKLKASKGVKEKIEKEIKRFENVAGSSSESVVERSYIETLLEMPWDKMSKDSLDLEKAEKILDEEHYGLSKVKERILEFLAVRALTKKGSSPIICLVGPPGTGKTSIAKSMAKALNKKYVRISLGGIHDEAEIRGHRKTYVGAMPGRIAMGLKEAGVKNPLMLLDEIDKIGKDYKGDTSAALLEVLDGEQNKKFRDHYIELPMDLSEVLFITTANDLSEVKGPLRDRMEIIQVTSYTSNEKFHIAKEHLVKKQKKKNGILEKQLTITDKALKDIISLYTREAGVRELERKLGAICRKAAKEILKDKKTVVKVSNGNLEAYLGKPRYSKDRINGKDEVGIVRGLAWTSVGGDTLEIEVNVMAGKGKLELTGQLGDVMKESARAGLSYIRSVSEKYQIADDFFEKHDFHIHIPEGAVPKDGPSAGITMALAMLSAITGRKVRRDVAMTGEITLRGRVLPIGGLKEKILAAKEAGMKTVFVPKNNEKDIEEISKEIKDGLEILFIEHMEEMIETAFAD